MTNLPNELVLQILASKRIKKQDLMSLRLVSKRISRVATDLLFSRIYISKFKSDRATFFNIAVRPHLAVAVKTVTWLEMAEDDTAFSDIAEQNALTGGAVDGSVPHTTLDWDAHFSFIMRRLACTLFWLPFEDLQTYPDEASKEQYKRQRREERAEAIHSFTPLFFAALDNMPNLKVLASQPMPPSRLLSSHIMFTRDMFPQGPYHEWDQLAGSLENLRFDNCNLNMDHLGALSEIPDLLLRQFVSLRGQGPEEKADGSDPSVLMMAEEDALAFLNKTGTSDLFITHPEAIGSED
ncbi:hypothetical protein V8C42DRAFT_343454 [Trichoderma barbatum]